MDVVGCGNRFFWASLSERKDDTPEDIAFKRCAEQLRIIGHPAYVSVPRVKAHADVGGMIFIWGISSGLSIGNSDVHANCIVSGDEITSLAINGKERIWHIPN